MKHQLYLKCQYCHTYFEYNGGRRSSVCSDRCKVAKWRFKKLSPPPLEYVDMSDPKVLLDNSVNSKNASVRHEWRKRKEES